MTAPPSVSAWTRPVRARSLWEDGLLAAPLVLATAAIAWRLGGVAVAVAVVLAGLGLVALIATRRAARYDRAWLVSALDASRGDLEDSSDLMFANSASLGPLQRLQRERIAARVAAVPVPELYRARLRRLIAAAWIAALVVVGTALAWPGGEAADGELAPASEGLPSVPGVPRLVAQRLVVVPPAYTGLPRRTLTTLDARVPAGSKLIWTLRFTPEPSAARLTFLDAGFAALTRTGEDWTAARMAERPALYRVMPAGAPARPVPPLHRIDVIADAPPRIKLVTPAATLNPLAPGQRTWRVAFEVTDDHAVDPNARLRIVVAQGEGENVRFSERIIAVRGTGEAKRRIFTATIDIAGMGFSESGDLVAQLTAADTRAPAPHRVTGPSVILRRPPARVGEASGLEAMTRRVMPAYFRSQRQIIIDAEALLAERPRPAADRFLARSDTIGADQSLLRLRYGQFMGEETGGGATAAMPTSDAEETATPAEATAETPAETHGPDDGHGHDAASATPPAFGEAGDVLNLYGHAHDESEAATLLDPGTRATLRQALDAMWASERALRQGDPRGALPHAYRALRFIKQVQQATRIFLARTGTQLPPIDPARRLTGDRSDLGPRTLPSAAGTPVDAAPLAIWRALGERNDASAIEALTRWLRTAPRVPDPLAISAAIDALRRDPACGACREKLRGALWSALPRPAPGIARRRAGDAVGQRYLEALR